MILSFKRITSSGKFIPEIDGLRFIAIASVICFHLALFISAKDNNQYVGSFHAPLLKTIIFNGDVGVPLFFVISGFILALPFAGFHIKNGKSVNLKSYFFRRLTRLEPPYILVMTVLFLAHAFFLNKLPLSTAVSSFLSSIFYVHNFVFGYSQLPLLNVVAWSLEIEVQFYLLAPFFAYMFCLKSPNVRRLFNVAIIVFFLTLNYSISLPFRSLINFVQYFLVGFLLADLYVSKSYMFSKTKFDTLIGIFLFGYLYIFKKGDFDSNSGKLLWELSLLVTIFFLYYLVLFHQAFKFLSINIITNIGGMCYSIYLLHYPIISLFGNSVVKYRFSQYSIINWCIYAFLLTILIMIVSGLFFLLIEKPCMKRGWYKNKLFGYSAI